MGKNVFIVFIAAVFPAAALFAGQSDSYTGNFAVRQNDSGCFTIYDYRGSSADIVIPEEVNDIPVNEIYGGVFGGAFKDKNLNSVVIPQNIKQIGENAFAGNNLKRITIGGNLMLAGAFDNDFEDSYKLNKFKGGHYLRRKDIWLYTNLQSTADGASSGGASGGSAADGSGAGIPRENAGSPQESAGIAPERPGAGRRTPADTPAPPDTHNCGPDAPSKGGNIRLDTPAFKLPQSAPAAHAQKMTKKTESPLANYPVIEKDVKAGVYGSYVVEEASLPRPPAPANIKKDESPLANYPVIEMDAEASVYTSRAEESPPAPPPPGPAKSRNVRSPLAGYPVIEKDAEVSVYTGRPGEAAPPPADYRPPAVRGPSFPAIESKPPVDYRPPLEYRCEPPAKAEKPPVDYRPVIEYESAPPAKPERPAPSYRPVIEYESGPPPKHEKPAPACRPAPEYRNEPPARPDKQECGKEQEKEIILKCHIYINPDKARIHRVVRGDSLMGIARKFYGEQNACCFPLISLASQNLIRDCDTITVGDYLIIPDIKTNLNANKNRREIRDFFLETAARYRVKGKTTLYKSILKAGEDWK